MDKQTKQAELIERQSRLNDDYRNGVISRNRWIHDCVAMEDEAHAVGLRSQLQFTAEEIAAANEEYEAETDTAVDWLMAVRKFGLARANEMFPQ